jgi:hypothetical protein
MCRRSRVRPPQPRKPGRSRRAGPVVTAALLGTRIADEAARVVANARTTHYQHRVLIDEATGTYDLDCSAFVS